MSGDDGALYDDRPDEEYGTRCGDGDHSSCPHASFGYALSQVEPDSHRGWIIDDLGGEGLCRCECHRDCPAATGGLAVSEWLYVCTCNGALGMIDRHRRAASSKLSAGPHSVKVFSAIRPGVEQARRKRAARRAAEKRGEGLTVDAVERIVQEEWRRHGLDSPHGAIARRIADEIVNPPGMVERSARRARLYRDLAGLPVRLRRATRGGLSETLERLGREMGGAFTVATGQQWVEIPLNPGALEEAGEVAGRAVFLPSTMTLTRVEARLAAGGEVEVWPYPPVGPSDRALGAVPAGESERLSELIAIATRVDQPCVCPAAFVRARDGGWQVFVNRPLQRVT